MRLLVHRKQLLWSSLIARHGALMADLQPEVFEVPLRCYSFHACEGSTKGNEGTRTLTTNTSDDGQASKPPSP